MLGTGTGRPLGTCRTWALVRTGTTRPFGTCPTRTLLRTTTNRTLGTLRFVHGLGKFDPAKNLGPTTRFHGRRHHRWFVLAGDGWFHRSRWLHNWLTPCRDGRFSRRHRGSAHCRLDRFSRCLNHRSGRLSLFGRSGRTADAATDQTCTEAALVDLDIGRCSSVDSGFGRLEFLQVGLFQSAGMTPGIDPGATKLFKQLLAVDPQFFSQFADTDL
jgi:hypothetical protein